MATASDVIVACDNLCEVFGRDFMRKKLSTLRRLCKGLPSSRRPEVSWSLNVLEVRGEAAFRAVMPPAPKKAKPAKAPAKKKAPKKKTTKKKGK